MAQVLKMTPQGEFSGRKVSPFWDILWVNFVQKIKSGGPEANKSSSGKGSGSRSRKTSILEAFSVGATLLKYSK